jgi:hypothetical protein
MSSSWWRLLNRGNVKSPSSAVRRRERSRSKSRRTLFEPLEPRAKKRGRVSFLLKGRCGQNEPRPRFFFRFFFR